MKTKNSLKLFIIFLIVYVFCIFNCSITFAANEGLKVGTYTSYDGQHTITVGEDGTILYDGTTSLTETADERGNILKGSSGTFYQLNNSKLVNGTDYTVFSLNTEPVVDENGGIEVWSNGNKVNTYADLQSAVDAAQSGDTIKITKDLDVVGGAYVSGKNLTIDGGSHTLNSATWANSVFVVEEDATLNINNLTIDGGATGFEVDRDAVTGTNLTIPLKSGSDTNDPKQNLSAIISKGDLIADKLNINNNYLGGNGAAIRVLTGNITLNNSNFNHNRASTGGAIYIGSNFKESQTTYPVQNVVLENTNISENFSNNAGGMFIYNTNKVSMKNSNFLNNSVTGGKGGGIYLSYQGSTDRANYHSMGKQLGLDYIQTEIDNCTFDANWVGNDGFAIENQGAEMLITNTTFKNNVGIMDSKSTAAISNMGDEYEYYDVTLKNCILEKNRGGCAGIGDHGTLMNLVVEDTKFIENKSWSTMLIYSGDAVFRNCEFIREKATQGVIVVSIYSHPVNNPTFRKPVIVLEDCTFTDTVNGSADVQLRKYGRKIAYNSATLYLEGNTNGNIHIWDDNRLVVNGNHTGNIYKDSLTSAEEGIIISENATVNGKVDYNNDQYTYTLVFKDMEDGYSYQRYLYLDKDRTYTQKEFFMEHFISEDGYMLKYYTDSSYTTEWDYTASITTNKANLYGKWVEHTHTYDGSTILYENAIYEQCECGYLGKSLTLSAPSDLAENDKEKPIVVHDEIGINSADYTITYQVMKDGKWEDYNGVPVNAGTYKAILTYNNMSIEEEYTIAERIGKPEDTNTPQKPEGDSNTSQTPGNSTDTTGKTEDNADKTENQDNNIENPVTSDNIILFVITSILSLVAIILLVIRFKK